MTSIEKFEDFWAVVRGRPLKARPTQEEIDEGIRRTQLYGPRGEHDGEFEFTMSGVTYRGKALTILVSSDGKRHRIEADVRPTGTALSPV